MAPIILIEPTELYNILNQHTSYPCLSDPNFLLLIDARNKLEYDESHIITAKLGPKDGDYFTVPYDAELECKTHVIIYDSNCRFLRDKSPAIDCATVVANNGSKNPVKILRGGYEDFSAMYPFLRTQKILYMPQEYDVIETYPCEILPGTIYIGNREQASSNIIHKELKVRAHINLSTEDDKFFTEEDKDSYLQIPIEDSVGEDFTEHIESIIQFIDEHRKKNNTILIWSTNGISRSAAACITYLMYYYKWSLRDAWRHIISCKFTIRPNRGLVKQLADFEEKATGKQVTNVDDPNY